MSDEIAHRYRRLIVNEVPSDDFIQLKYRMTPAAPLDLAGAAIRTLLILTVRTISPLGFEKIERSDVANIGAVILPHGPYDSGDVTVVVPKSIVSREEGLTQLVLTATSAAEYSYCSEIWLNDIVLPASIREWFVGPRLGVPGIRGKLDIRGRPLLGYTVKSRTRASLDAVLNSCAAAMRGGVDLLVDDILSTDPTGPLAFAERVPAIATLVESFNGSHRRGQSQVGYVVNVGAASRQAERYMRMASSLGAFGCLVDCFTMGFGNVKELIDIADADHLGLAFFSSNMGSGVMGRNPDEERLAAPVSARRFLRTGFSEALTAKLSRLAGADGVHTGSSGTECFEIAEYAHTPRALRAEDGFRHSFPVAEGDIQFLSVAQNVLEMGADIIIETASGIANHPGGVEEGASAFRLLVGCMNDELGPVDIDNVVNILRHRHPSLVDPEIGVWKEDNDSRIRGGWDLNASIEALDESVMTDELRQLMRGRGKVAR